MHDVMTAVVEQFTRTRDPEKLRKEERNFIRRGRTVSRIARERDRLLQRADALTKQHTVKMTQLAQREETLRVDQAFAEFPEVSLEPFRWRTPEGWPRLALFSYDEVRKEPFSRTIWGFGVRLHGEYDSLKVQFGGSVTMPAFLTRCFEDVIQRLTGKALYGKEDLAAIAIPTKFYERKRVTGQTDVQLKTCYVSGAIPAEVLERVEARRGKFEQLLLVAEAAEWTIEEQTIPAPERSPCPLVVGVAKGHLWLIDRYNETPKEAYVVNEFTN